MDFCGKVQKNTNYFEMLASIEYRTATMKVSNHDDLIQLVIGLYIFPTIFLLDGMQTITSNK